MSSVCADTNIDVQPSNFTNVSDLNSGDVGDFSELNGLISNASDSLNMSKSYSQTSLEDSLTLSKSIAINGNGNSINSSSDDPLFKVKNTTGANFIFKNITFFTKSYQFLTYDNSTGNASFNLTFLDCYFNVSVDFENRAIQAYDDGVYYTSNYVPPEIAALTKSIIGSSQGVDAAIKLAKWVGKNVKSETAPGFYQTPSETLARRLGNCCCQTDLFLLMCYYAGVMKTCKVYFVQIGNMKFHQRHFFAVIDNVVVDVGSKGNRPWGHADLSRPIVRITPYPMIPIEREYNY